MRFVHRFGQFSHVGGDVTAKANHRLYAHDLGATPCQVWDRASVDELSRGLPFRQQAECLRHGSHGLLLIADAYREQSLGFLADLLSD
jgi:hypothetical protein